MTELFKNKSVDAILRDIRGNFASHRASKVNHPLHWGQFLDGLGQTPAQVGLYGGVAGCLAYTAGGRSDDDAAKEERVALVSYWQDRTNTSDATAEDNLRQNVRLSFLLVGLAYSHKFTDVSVQEVWKLLKDRRLPTDRLWTDADFSGNTQQPSEYSSAMILILFAVIRRKSIATDEEFREFDRLRADAGMQLQKLYLDERKKVRPYKLVVLIAIMLSLENNADKRTISDLYETTSNNVEIKSRYTYFFDYKRKNGEHARDYLILPIGILGAYLFLGNGLPNSQYFFAKKVLAAIESSLASSVNHLFMEGERPSALEQGLVVIALESWTPPKTWLSIRLLLPKLMWSIQKDIEFNRWYATLFFLGLYGPILAATWAETLMNFLTEKGMLINFLPYIALCQLIPNWAVTTIAVVAGVIVKPQDLLKIFIGKKQ